MPTARIITSEPQRAAKITQSLTDSGFDVQVVSPLEPRDSDCDIEIDLDQVAGADLNFVVEDAAAYFTDNGEPRVEREFVFAPAWRACKQKLARMRESIFGQVASASLRSEDRIAAQKLRAASWRTGLLQSARRSGSSLKGFRRRFELEKFNANARRFVHDAGLRIGRTASEFARSTQARTEGLRSRTSVSGKSRLRWLADCWLRPSFSIGAGMVLAFLLGFWAAKAAKKAGTGISTPTTVEASVSEAVLASPSAVEVNAPRKAATKKATTKKAITKKAITKKAISPPDKNDDFEEFEEVVVRRYPRREVMADTKSSEKKVKQYSDLDD